MKVKSASNEYFALAGKLSKISQWSLWIAACIVIVGMFVGNKVQTSAGWNTVLVLQALFLAAYSFLSLGSSLANFKARKIKINDVVDNAFGTEIGDTHSENYFDNDEIKEGSRRLLYNTAESCFFTFHEMKSMIGGVVAKTLVPLAVLVVGLILNRAEVIMAIFRITAVLLLIIQGVRFFITISQLDRLLQRMTDTLKHKISSSTQFNAESINYALEYETLMVWYGVKIPDKVYYKINIELTDKWNTMKSSFVIK